METIPFYHPVTDQELASNPAQNCRLETRKFPPLGKLLSAQSEQNARSPFATNGFFPRLESGHNNGIFASKIGFHIGRGRERGIRPTPTWIKNSHRVGLESGEGTLWRFNFLPDPSVLPIARGSIFYRGTAAAAVIVTRCETSVRFLPETIPHIYVPRCPHSCCLRQQRYCSTKGTI